MEVSKMKKPALPEQADSENKEVCESKSSQCFPDNQIIGLKNNPELDVAVAEKITGPLRNTKMMWAVFVLLKCSNPKISTETLKQYLSFPVSRQGRLKDVGGFVFGLIRGNDRKNGSVMYRQATTIDLDFASNDFWLLFTMLFDVAAVLYSTRKHSPESPRYRLVILLDRPVLSDEYEAVSRWVAGQFGIELCDPTTFQFNRLMYWPSICKEATFEFNYQDGPSLCVDEVLSKYNDWRNCAEWPISKKAGSTINRQIKEQQDPLTKSGIIGAFCRAYTIHEAIEKFLPKIYLPTADPNRYTYAKGSTYGGLIVYADKFAYSHHGSDPAADEHAHNAFDLVRLHAEDEDFQLTEGEA